MTNKVSRLPHNAIPCRFKDGREWPSITAAAKESGYKINTLFLRLNNGQFPFTEEKPTPRKDRNRKECFFNGKRYKSFTEAGKQNGVSRQLVGKRRKQASEGLGGAI